MSELKYIYNDAQGVTRFDKYFEYLQSIKTQLPLVLGNFALATNRYELNGNDTLHDAWLKSLNMTKDYGIDKPSITKVQLSLLLATHLKIVHLEYSEVIHIKCSLASNLWPMQPVDLLVHEVSLLAENTFQHFIQFDRGMWIEVVFSAFKVHESSV
jgi:hypothetical protein